MADEEWTSLSLRQKRTRTFRRASKSLAAAKASGDRYAVCECYAELQRIEIHAESASLRQKASQLIDRAELDLWHAEGDRAKFHAEWFYAQVTEYFKTRPGSYARRAKILAKVRRFVVLTDPPEIVGREILRFLAAPDEWHSAADVRSPERRAVSDAGADASPSLLTEAEAAEVLGITRDEVLRLWCFGRISCVRIGGRIHFKREALTEYVEWRKGMVTEEEAAEILGVSVDRIAYWRSTGRRLPYTPGKPILISLADLEDFKVRFADFIQRARQIEARSKQADQIDGEDAAGTQMPTQCTLISGKPKTG
jgi:excisionase family DNA binding protein